jgi:hypothetical protein
MSTENPGVRLGDLLTSAGLLRVEALREAMLTAKQQNMPVGRILITSGYLSENQLQAAVQAQSLLKDGLIEMPIVVKALGILVHEQTSLEQAMARCGWHKENGAVTNKLGELLIEAQIISNEDLLHALAQCENIGLPLGRMLVLTNCLSEQMLSNALNAQVLLRDHKVTRAQAIKGLQSAQKRQLPLETTLTDSGDLQLPSSTNVRLGDFLIEAGLIDQANLMNAVEIGLVQGKLIGQVLRQLNLLVEKDLDAALDLQKMIAAGTLRRREATEILGQIHAGKASLQDILKRKHDPYSLDNEPDKDELFLDQFLKIAGIITQNEIDKAIKHGTQNSDLFGKMLLSAGIMEEQMVEASLDAYALVSDDTLTMDQAMIALKNCQVRGHSLEDAFKDLGWSADTEEDEHLEAKTEPPTEDSFAPLALPIGSVKETATKDQARANTADAQTQSQSKSQNEIAAPIKATSTASSANANAKSSPSTITTQTHTPLSETAPSSAAAATTMASEQQAKPASNPIATPISPTSKSALPPRETTTQTVPNSAALTNSAMASSVPSNPVLSPSPIKPTSQSQSEPNETNRAGSEFPTITPVVSRRASGQSTGDFQKYNAGSAPSSADLSPKPSYNASQITPQTSATATPSGSSTTGVNAPNTAAYQPDAPVRTEPVTSVRYGTSKEFAPPPERAVAGQTSAGSAVVEQLSPALESFPERNSQPQAATPPPAPPPSPTPPVVAPTATTEIVIKEPTAAPSPLSTPAATQNIFPSIAPSTNAPFAPAAPEITSPPAEVRAPSNNAFSALNASWGLGAKQGPQSNPWDAGEEEPVSQSPPLKSLSSTSFYNTPPISAQDLEQVQIASAAPTAPASAQQTSAPANGGVAGFSVPVMPPQPTPTQSTTSFYELPTLERPVQAEPDSSSTGISNNAQSIFQQMAAQIEFPAPSATPLINASAPIASGWAAPPEMTPHPTPAEQPTDFSSTSNSTSAQPATRQQAESFNQMQPEAQPRSGHVPFTPSTSEQVESDWGGPAKSPPPNPWAAAQAVNKPAPEPEAKKPELAPAAQKPKPTAVAPETRTPAITQPTLGVPAALPGLSTPAGENPGWPSQTNQTGENQLSSFADNPGWKPATPDPAPGSPVFAAPRTIEPPPPELPGKFATSQGPLETQQPQFAQPMQQGFQAFQQPQQPQQQAIAQGNQQNMLPNVQQSAPQFSQQMQAAAQQALYQQQQKPSDMFSQQPGQAQFAQQPQMQQPATQQPQHQQQMQESSMQQPQLQQAPQMQQPQMQQMFPPPMQQQTRQDYQQQPQASQQVKPVPAPQPQNEGWEFSGVQEPKPAAEKPKGLNAFMPKGKKDKPS